jgi:hypothetical protein
LDQSRNAIANKNKKMAKEKIASLLLLLAKQLACTFLLGWMDGWMDGCDADNGWMDEAVQIMDG